MSRTYGKLLWAALTLVVIVSLVGCGGSGPAATATPQGATPKPGTSAPTATPQPGAAKAATATPGAVKAPTAKPGATSQSSDPSSRVGDSVGRLLTDEPRAFKSFHIEASGKDPKWNATTKKVEFTTYSYKADQADTDLYLLSTTQDGTEPAKTLEGYSIKGGIGEPDGKEYEVVNGKLVDSFGVTMAWVFFPLQVIVPLSIAATGTSAQGTESIDGRVADKYALDSAKAPAGVMGALTGMFSYTSSKGTAWVDKETGALLKAVLDYELDLVDPPGSKTVVGKGVGHLELLVTKVGKTTVTLPK